MQLDKLQSNQLMHQVLPITPNKINSGNSRPFCAAINPAVGNTAIVGIGGIIVSINAARNTPAYR